MENAQLRQSIWEKHVSTNEKFVYYMISLASAAIGFAVTQAPDTFTKLDSILVLSVGSWLGSIHCGLSFIVSSLGVFRANIARLYIDDGINPIDGTPIPEMKNPTKAVDEALRKSPPPIE